MKAKEITLNTKEVELKTYRISLPCDAEGCTGEMFGTGKYVEEDGGSFHQHECDKCKQKLFLKDQQFPRIYYKEKPKKIRKK